MAPPSKGTFSFVDKSQLPSETSWPKADMLTALTNVCFWPNGTSAPKHWGSRSLFTVVRKHLICSLAV